MSQSPRRSNGRRVRPGLLLFALLVGVLLAWLVPTTVLPLLSDKSASSREPPAASRREGDWTVTPLGDLRLSHVCPERHRLLVGCKGRAPELWDTRAGRRVAVLWQHQGSLGASAWSPDKARFVTAAEIGYFKDSGGQATFIRPVYIWQTDTGRLIKKIDVDLSAGTRDSTDWQVRWLGENTLLLELYARLNPARASVRTVLALLDVKKGHVTAWAWPLQIGEALTLAPDGKRAVATHQYSFYKSAGGGGVARGGRGITYTVHLIDLAGLKVIATLDDGEQPGPAVEQRSVGNVAWSPDSRRVVTVASDHTARVWDGLTGKPLCTLVGHSDWIVSVCFSPDAARVLTASEDDTARVWDAVTGRPVATLAGHTAGLFEAVFDPAGRRALTCSEDQTARLWDARTGKPLRVWADHESNVCGVEFLAGGKQVRTRTARGIVRVWSALTGALLSEKKPERNVSYRYGNCFLRDSGGLTEVWVGPPGAVPPPVNDGRETIVFGESVITDDSPNAGLARPRLTLKGHKGSVGTVAFSSDGKVLASAGDDRAVIVWEPARWDRVTGRGRTILRQPVEVRSMALSPDGRTVAAGCEDGLVRFWDMAGVKERLAVKRHAGAVACLAFTSDGKALASGGIDRAVKVWDLGGAKERWAAAAPLGSPKAVAFSPDGALLAAAGTAREGWQEGGNEAGRPGEVVLWDAASGVERRRLKGHEDEVSAVVFTPDSKTLITASADKTVRLWDVATGEERAVLNGHTGWVTSVAVSRDGKLLASGDWQGTIRLWEAETGKSLAAFKGYTNWVNSLAFTPDGKTLASGGADGLSLWDVTERLRRNALKGQ
jgi:WD40 repeat protein